MDNVLRDYWDLGNSICILFTTTVTCLYHSFQEKFKGLTVLGNLTCQNSSDLMTPSILRTVKLVDAKSLKSKSLPKHLHTTGRKAPFTYER